ncbi:hypothetical protein ACIPY6_03010 [Streptomyces sp. NPDC090054]|uniref:hypothetical protein n=1 Tax=Streptomyces sp. NPDC090054 TaxID=3365933 RepID=UPI00381CBBB0
MTDSIRPGGIPSRSRRDRTVLLGIACAVIIGVGGFFAGRASVDNGPCRAVQEIAAKERADTLALPDSDPTTEARPKAAGFRRYAALVHSRPECFSHSDRAEADTVTQELGGLP